MSPEQAVTFSLARAERALQSKLIPVGAPLLVFQQFIQKVGERLGFLQILKNLSELKKKKLCIKENYCRYFTGAHVLLRWKSATIDSIGQMVEIDKSIVEHMKVDNFP